MSGRRGVWRRSVQRERPMVVHVTTTDMSLDWLLAPQLVAFGDADNFIFYRAGVSVYIDFRHARALGNEQEPR